ncbi:NUDIX hydrolase [Confluentibacter citreus]|uniref:NUDIX hydrolase n=1 Tax=Confluentibacter citreus TaxID=2007307 RepID=UPI000C29221E|nr:CoA pyrophosphatase [Confluentibacter citreus]
MDFNEFSGLSSKIKNIQLPGEGSHLKMIPPSRKAFLNIQNEAINQAKKAGVLALFYPDENNQTKFILILRKTYEGIHSAQVGFPGGKLETQDTSLMEAAIRETFEEVGVLKSTIEILTALTEVYIAPSNFYVHPFIAITPKTPFFKLQEEEVEALIEVDLQHFLDENVIMTNRVKASYNIDVEVPTFLLNGHIVWGATAMILSEIKDLLKELI